MRRLTHLLRGCDGSLHASGGLREDDRGLRSVRSARGLQGRQELELLTPGARRMLVCVRDLVSLGLSLWQLLRETRWKQGVSRQWLRGAGAWLWTHGVKSSSLHEGRRCRSMRECVRGFRRSTCPAPLPSSVCECVLGFRHTARVMRLAASGAHHCTRAGAAGDCSGPLPSSVCECRQGFGHTA